MKWSKFPFMVCLHLVLWSCDLLPVCMGTLATSDATVNISPTKYAHFVFFVFVKLNVIWAISCDILHTEVVIILDSHLLTPSLGPGPKTNPTTDLFHY